MGCKQIFLILSIAHFNVSFSHNVVRWLESPRLTDWGTWGAPQMCRDNQWVSGIELKIEGAQGQRFLRNDDDTALNGVELICLDGYNADRLKPYAGQWGEFRGAKYCHNGIATGFELRSEPDQRGGDDVAAVDMAIICTNFDGNTEWKVGGDVLSYGHWTGAQNCPPRTAVCGINTQVEEPQGGGDDTSLNNVNVACCELPNPVASCRKPKLVWVNILSCRGGISCETTFTTGLTKSMETSTTVSESFKFFEKTGFSVGLEANAEFIKSSMQASYEFGQERVNGKTASQIIGETRTETRSVTISMNECYGSVQQLYIRCGIIEVKTNEYQCGYN